MVIHVTFLLILKTQSLKYILRSVTSNLIADFPNIRVIISSGSEMNSNITEILKNKNIGFMKKPYTIQDLSDNIHKIISNKNVSI